MDLKNAAIDVNPTIKNKNNPNQDSLYELYSVIIHEGSINAGHYYSYCKYEDSWYEFNDSKVNIIHKNSVLCNKDAYILFYKLVVN